jgi:hypothetical protein
MLTDEELTARLTAAFHESTDDLSYSGRVPRVRRTGGLAATSVLVAGTALALAPAALEHGQDTPAPAVPSTHPGAHDSAHAGNRTVDVGGLHLTYDQVSRLKLSLVVAPHLSLPADAVKLDIDAAGNADAWYVADPAEGDPQVYVKPRSSPMMYGLLNDDWTRQQFIDFLEHPVATERGQN